MTTTDTTTARDLLDAAREHYEASQEAMQALGREVRRLDEWQWQRVDAYPGWEGARDVGAGASMNGWLDEIERFLDGKDEACTGFAAANAWGPCDDCGRRLEGHAS
jgi:hypothetical protein